MKTLELRAQAFDTDVVNSRGDSADDVNEDRAASQAGPLVRAYVPPTDDDQDDDGINEVGDGEVQGAEEADTAARGASPLETSLGCGDLGRQDRQCLFERGSRGVILLQEAEARSVKVTNAMGTESTSGATTGTQLTFHGHRETIFAGASERRRPWPGTG